MLLYIVYMMDCCGFLVLSSLLAYLAFIFIKSQDFFSFRFPFAPCVKSMYVFFYAFFYKCNVTLCHVASLLSCRRRTRTSDFQLRRLASFHCSILLCICATSHNIGICPEPFIVICSGRAKAPGFR